MKIIKGNLITMALKGDFDVIVHGCNCFNNMGAGIAKDIKRFFPEAYEADLKTKSGDFTKLGTYTYAWCDNVCVVNAYTQYRYGGNVDRFEYAAFESILNQLKTNMDKGFKVGFPLIGCGHAKGDKDHILALIQQYFPDDNCKVVVL